MQYKHFLPLLLICLCTACAAQDKPATTTAADGNDPIMRDFNRLNRDMAQEEADMNNLINTESQDIARDLKAAQQSAVHCTPPHCQAYSESDSFSLNPDGSYQYSSTSDTDGKVKTVRNNGKINPHRHTDLKLKNADGQTDMIIRE